LQVLQFPSQYQPGETPYQIFQDRMAAITSIVTGIKNIISNKYINKQNSMIAENIQNEIDKQKAIDLSNLIMSPAPDEIYPANLEDTIGQFYDKFAAMGPMMKKETMMGNLPYPEIKTGPMTQKEIMTGGLPSVGGITPTVAPTTTEAMIPKTDLYQLYNVIKDLPTGEITWDNIYKKMTEKKPYFMGTTAPEQFVLNQMLGQVTDPRAKIASDINLAKLVKEAFEPEKLTEWEKKTELFLQTNPTDEEIKEFVGGRIAPEKMSDFEMKWNLLMQRDHTVEEEKELIGAFVESETKLSVKDILANIPEGFEISSLNVSTTGTTSFSYKPIGTTTAWEFNTWDEAKEFLRTHPQEGFIGKIETHGKGFDLTWYEKSGTEGLNPITGPDIKTFETMLYGDEDYFGVKTPEEYEKAVDYIRRTKKDFPIPTFLEIVEKNLGRCLDNNNNVLDIDLYSQFYEYYKNELKGKPPKYLPPELISKTGIFKNKYGSALADDYELDFEAMKKDGVTEEEILKKLQGIEER
jgi:hypothetical protein